MYHESDEKDLYSSRISSLEAQIHAFLTNSRVIGKLLEYWPRVHDFLINSKQFIAEISNQANRGRVFSEIARKDQETSEL